MMTTNGTNRGKFKMGIFRHHPTEPPRYSLDNLRRDIASAVERARDAHVHSVEIERAVHAIADWQAQRRAMTTPVY
jgi:hypothetical protein